jgi:hypothetical protein
MSIDHNGRLGSQEAAQGSGGDGKGVEDWVNPDFNQSKRGVGR